MTCGLIVFELLHQAHEGERFCFSNQNKGSRFKWLLWLGLRLRASVFMMWIKIVNTYYFRAFCCVCSLHLSKLDSLSSKLDVQN